MGAMVRYGEEMRQSKSGPFDALAIPLNAPWYISVTIKMHYKKALLVDGTNPLNKCVCC